MENIHIWDNFFSSHFGLNNLVTLPASIKQRESYSSRRASAAQRSTFDNIEESLDHKMHPRFEQRPPSLEAILDSRIMLAASHKCL